MSHSTLKMKRVFIIIGLFFTGIINSPAFASNTYCVDAAASSAGTGSCWASPFKEFSSALSAATTVGDQILVAKGTYKPAGSTRSCTFLLNTNGIGVYGGYPTGGGIRDPINNPTILSGDIGTASDISDNCYHVITIGTNVRLNGVLDGVTITAGNANSSTYPDSLGGGLLSKDGGTLTISNVTLSNNYALRGGGMYNQGSSPTLNNVIFSNNFATDATSGKAGGLYNYSNSSPTLNNVSFIANSSARDGGGMYNYINSSPILNNVIFQSNIATGSGAGIYNNSNSNITLSNTTFTGNTAQNHAGAIYNSANSNSTIVNSTFSGNTATANAGAIYSDTGTHSLNNSTFTNNTSGTGTALYNKSLTGLTITNSLFWGNSTGQAIVNSGSPPMISYSLVQNSNGSGGSWVSSLGVDAGYNVDSNPLLSALGNYGGSTQTHALLPNSAAIDAGNSCGSSDQRGLSRVSSCDIGAFESQGFTLTKTSGDPQSTPINTSFANPLVVNLSSAASEPVSGGTVTFTDSGTTAKTTLSSAQQVSLSGNSASLTAPTANGIMGSYVVQASVRGAVSSVSFSLTNTAAPTSPTAPSTLVATAISATQINLTWVDNSSTETGFKLESPAGTLLNTAAANATTYSHTGLTCGTTYTYSLNATNATGDSTPITATASTAACAVVIPNAPSTLVATAISATQINLTWVDNSSTETGFKVESPAGTLLNTAAANATTYSHTGLTCGTTYTYSLNATNATGDSTPITATASTAACAVVIPNYNLGVISVGTGSGVVSGTPAGSYPSGTSINLSALASTGSIFTGWSPSSCGSTFNLITNLNCIAVFDAVVAPITTYTLNLNKAGFGTGTISGTPAGTYPANTAINLTAVAAAGSSFTGWSPSLCGSSFNLTANLNCTASFEVLPPATYSLTLKTAGTGTGVISGTTAGSYPANTAINLTAVASTGSSFMGWSPSSCASFSLSQNTTCTAIFNSNANAAMYNFNIKTLGNGAGIVGGTPAGKYVQNTAVNLLAVADSHSEFVGWAPSSCASGFMLNADSTCVANFTLKSVQNFNLVLNKTGAGTGTILGTVTGIYPTNTAINLVAIADNNSEFTGWNPSSCGTGFNLLADTSCTANFTRKAAASYHLNIAQAGSGSGTISGNAAGDYVSGTVISLLATANEDSVLTGWSPMNCGAAFALAADTQCTAVFDKKPTTTSKPTYNLTLLASGVSNANLNATPAAPYEAGTQVKLSATAPNAEFLGWQGNGCDSSLTMDRNLICVATFQTLSAGRVRFVDDMGNVLAQLTEKKSVSSIKVNVARVEGKSGAISVRYQTQAGTALAGVDYQSVSGTLAWNDADNSVKTIEIPIVQNSKHYGDNAFYLILNSDDALVKLDSSFIKLTLQDVLIQSPCNNALQLDIKGKLQGNAACFTHRVNEAEITESVRLAASNMVHVQTLIDVNPQYVGQYGEVLMVAVYFPDLQSAPISFQRRGNTWLHWSGSLEELSVVARYPSLPKQVSVDIYKDFLSDALGRFEVYVGYRLADGSIIFNGLNVLKITVATALP